MHIKVMRLPLIIFLYLVDEREREKKCTKIICFLCALLLYCPLGVILSMFRMLYSWRNILKRKKLYSYLVFTSIVATLLITQHDMYTHLYCGGGEDDFNVNQLLGHLQDGAIDVRRKCFKENTYFSSSSFFLSSSS